MMKGNQICVKAEIQSQCFCHLLRIAHSHARESWDKHQFQEFSAFSEYGGYVFDYYLVLTSIINLLL